MISSKYFKILSLSLIGTGFFYQTAIAKNDCEQFIRILSSDEARALDAKWISESAAIKESDIPEKFIFKPVEQTVPLSGGKLKHWLGPTQNVYSPIHIESADGRISPLRLGSVPDMNADAAFDVYQDARKAYDHGTSEWASSPMEFRIAALEKFIGFMKAGRDQLIKSIMWEINKTESVAAGEVDRTIRYIEDTIIEARKLAKEWGTLGKEGNEIYQLNRGPGGVALVFAPYNYPLNETFTNLIPALIAGNSVVVKPAKWGVLLMEPLLEMFQKSLPPGVVNFVYGDGQVLYPKISQEGGYEFLGFIGGERGARAVMLANTRPNRTRAILGLGAKDMVVITESSIRNDADLQFLVNQQLEGCLSFNGQRCTAHKMIFIDRKVANKFIPAFAKSIDELTHGAPWLKNVKMTSSPDSGWVKRMADFTQDAVSKGAVIANYLGGRNQNGYFAPTLLVGVTPEMKIYNMEQFGTVIPVVIYDDISEPVEWQRQSPYGQQVAVYGNNIEEMKYFHSKLSPLVCRFNINSACKRGPDWVPFEAVKDSGMRPLSLRDAILEFTVNRVIWEGVRPGDQSILEQMHGASAVPRAK